MLDLCLFVFGVGFGFCCCSVVITFCVSSGLGFVVLRDGFAPFCDGG